MAQRGYLIETSVWVSIERGRIELGERFEDAPVAMSAITSAELLHGVHRAVTSVQRARAELFVEGLLARVPILPFGLAESRVYARLRSDLQVAGITIDSHDLLIAATALANEYAVVTTDKKSFPRVPGLAVDVLHVMPRR